MMRTGLFGVGFVGLIFLSAGCAGLGSGGGNDFTSDRADPPGWYINPPVENDYFYAVGWSGPTYKPSKSREQALERAVHVLAAQAQTYIQNQMVIRQNLNGVTYSDSLTQSEVQGRISGFQIVAERLIFDDGSNKSPPGTTYILIRIPKSSLELN